VGKHQHKEEAEETFASKLPKPRELPEPNLAKTVVEESPKPVAKKIVASADHKPPVITAKDIMAGFKRHMVNLGQRRLEVLARKYPDVAALLKNRKKTESPNRYE
jgi:hypothetical protein